MTTNRTRDSVGTTHKIDLYFDTGHDADLLEWYRSFVNEAQAKNIWLSLAEAVLAEGELRLDAFTGAAHPSGERQSVRLRIDEAYFPAIAHVWNNAKSGSRSATVIAALRHAKLDVSEGKRGVKVAILTGMGEDIPTNAQSPQGQEEAGANSTVPVAEASNRAEGAREAPPPSRESAAPSAPAGEAVALVEEGGDPEDFDDDLPSGDVEDDHDFMGLMAAVESIEPEDEAAEDTG